MSSFGLSGDRLSGLVAGVTMNEFIGSVLALTLLHSRGFRRYFEVSNLWKLEKVYWERGLARRSTRDSHISDD